MTIRKMINNGMTIVIVVRIILMINPATLQLKEVN